jgi:tetratricopeptide (TPR) repeat protein
MSRGESGWLQILRAMYGTPIIIGAKVRFIIQHQVALEKAMRLDPGNRDRYLWEEAFAYQGLGRYEDAITAYKGFLALRPDIFWAHSPLMMLNSATTMPRWQRRRKSSGLTHSLVWRYCSRWLARKVKSPRGKCSGLPTCARPARSDSYQRTGVDDHLIANDEAPHPWRSFAL